MGGLSSDSTGAVVGRRVLSWKAIIAMAFSVPLACLLLALSGCSNAPLIPVESSRLHVIAVLYGKYLSAHSGKMPADEQEFAAYIDGNEKDILFRRGCKSAQDLLAPSHDPQRLVVLYRDQRERLSTDWVAIEKQEFEEKDAKSQGIVQKRVRWFAANVGGVGQQIKEEEANRILAEQSPRDVKGPPEKSSGTPLNDQSARNSQNGFRCSCQYSDASEKISSASVNCVTLCV